MRALYSAATGMAAQELNVQVISNNIANLRTTGYKRQQVHFQDLLYQNLRRAGASTSQQNTQLLAGLSLGSGVKTTSTARVMSQGTLSSTEKDYDVAIRGDGFFRVKEFKWSDEIVAQHGWAARDGDVLVHIWDGKVLGARPATDTELEDWKNNAFSPHLASGGGAVPPSPEPQEVRISSSIRSGGQTPPGLQPHEWNLKCPQGHEMKQTTAPRPYI